MLQGIFAALLAPAALSQLTTTLTDPAERGVKLDVPGAVFATLGFFAVVFGFANAEEHGFTSVGTWGFLAVGAILLVVFVLLQRRGKNPLLPLRIVTLRDRGASMIAIFVAGAVNFGVHLYALYYLQIALDFTPLQTGLAVLPLCLGIMAAAMISTSVLLPRLGAKILVPAGMLVSAVGALLLTFVAAATVSAVDGEAARLDSLVTGYAAAYLACAVVLVVGAGATALMYRKREFMAADMGEPAVHM